jgi:hypothetical protein
MKNVFLKYVLTFPMIAISLGCLGASLAYMEISNMGGPRNISGDTKEYEITLNTIKLDPMSRITNKDDVFLRIRFDENQAFEIGRGQGWKLAQGGQVIVDQKLPLEPQYISGDETKFLLEVVHEQSVWGMGKADVSIIRCNTVAKELSEYNRSFQCFVPGEKTAVLTYRVAEKGVPPPTSGSESQVAAK